MLRQDLRFALRFFARRPGFAAVAVLTLALGIGATSAVFSLVEATLTESLPFTTAERLVLASSRNRTGGEDWPISHPDFLDWQAASQALEALEVYSSPVSFNLVADGEPEHVAAEMVSYGYFRLLGQDAAHGRVFGAEEDRSPPRRVLLLADHFFRSRFAGDPTVVGRTLRLNGESYEVIGVLPPGFRGLTDEAQIWLPVHVAAEALGQHYVVLRHYRWLQAAGRLAPERTLEEAQAELEIVAARLEAEHPVANRDAGVRLVALHEAWLGDLRLLLALVFGAAGLVLLLACVNIAQLLLIRAATRRREIALRLALGAGRRRLGRQLLTESLVLTFFGAILGLVLAAFGTEWLLGMAGLELRSFIEPRLDPKVIGVMFLVAGLCGLGFGLAPAFMGSQTRPAAALRESPTGSGPGRHRWLQIQVVAQVALSLILTVGSGILVRHFHDLRRGDLGFESAGLLTLRLEPEGERYDGQEPKIQLARRLIDELPQVPGVAELAIAAPALPGDDWHGGHYTIEERTEEGMVLLAFHFVSPSYFSTLGVPLVTGRDLSLADAAGGLPVVVVSEALAELYWPGQDPLGKRLKLGPREASFAWLTVVGVVGNLHHHGLAGEPHPVPDIYYSILQFVPTSPPTMNLMVSERYPLKR